MKKWKKLIITLLILISCITVNANQQIDTVKIHHNQEINDDSVLKYIGKFNIKYPKIVLAQSKLESRSYKSKLFKKQNNLFGFVAANKRTTTSHRLKHHKYAYYADYVESIEDYSLYQERFIANINSSQEYYRYLGKHYATDKQYITKLKRIVSKLN